MLKLQFSLDGWVEVTKSYKVLQGVTLSQLQGVKRSYTVTVTRCYRALQGSCDTLHQGVHHFPPHFITGQSSSHGATLARDQREEQRGEEEFLLKMAHSNK